MNNSEIPEANPRVFIVIPAYNEGQVLIQTIEELSPFGFPIVVVDDGSATPAQAHLSGHSVHYLRHIVNLGQGAALQTGMDYALANGADIVVHFDADGQHSPHLVERLIEPILRGKCDMAIGSRFLNSADRAQVPTIKQFLLKAGVFVSWVFSGLWLTDTHNGFRALSRQALQRIRLTENGYAHATEILELAKKAGLRTQEVPTTIRYTEYSMAKGQSIFNSINILVDLVLRRLIS